MPKVRIIRNTAIEGRPVQAGDVLDVDAETLSLLGRAAVILSAESIESSDPVAETRDPKPSRRR